MGSLRGAMAARGLRLPPRGSIQDRIIQEVLLRERNERYVAGEVLILLACKALGLETEQMRGLLEHYSDEVHQERYRPSIIRARKAAKAAVRKKEAEDKRRLAALDKLTVEDKGTSPPRSRKR